MNVADLARPIRILVLASSAIAACGGSESGGPAQGSEGQACYPNGTCDGTLSCFSNLCVNASADAATDGGGAIDAGGSDASTDVERDSGNDAGFDVRSMPGLVLWLDAAKGVTGTTAVTSWMDQSASGNDASPSGPAPPPSLAPSAIGGRPALHWSGSAPLAIAASATLGFGTGDFLVEVVAHVIQGNGGFFRADDGSGKVLVFYATSLLEADMLTPGDQAFHGTTLLGATKTGYVAGLVRTGTKIDFRLNGALDATGTCAAGTDLGTMASGKIGYGVDGQQDLAEIVVVKGTTSASDLAKLEAYMRSKYGL